MEQITHQDQEMIDLALLAMQEDDDETRQTGALALAQTVTRYFDMVAPLTEQWHGQ